MYVICQSGLRSYIACRILAGYCYEAYNFSGGVRYYDAVVNDRRLRPVAWTSVDSAPLPAFYVRGEGII